METEIIDLDTFVNDRVTFREAKDSRVVEREYKFTKCKRNNWDETKPEVILMQYTGLKDKNDTEIYEGDILDDCGHNDVVKYEEGGFWCHGGGGSDFSFYKVIGNIYENPELLEEK